MLPGGMPDEAGEPYSTSTVPRDIWLYCAAALMAAEAEKDAVLRERALGLGERACNAMAASGTMWKQHSLYRAGDLAPAGDPHYLGNLAIWMLTAAMGHSTLISK